MPNPLCTSMVYPGILKPDDCCLAMGKTPKGRNNGVGISAIIKVAVPVAIILSGTTFIFLALMPKCGCSKAQVVYIFCQP